MHRAPNTEQSGRPIPGVHSSSLCGTDRAHQRAFSNLRCRCSSALAVLAYAPIALSSLSSRGVLCEREHIQGTASALLHQEPTLESADTTGQPLFQTADMLSVHIPRGHRQRSHIRRLLRLYARQQERIPALAEPHRGGVPGAPDHQLGRHTVGAQALRALDHSSGAGHGLADRGAAPRLPRIQGQHLAAAAVLPLHSGIGQHDTIHHYAAVPAHEEPLHTGVPELLAGQALPREYVQRSSPGNAKVPVGLESAAHDTQRHSALPRLHKRLRDPALPASRPPTPQPLPEHVLRGGDLLDRGLRRLCARHLALPTLHGHHDMRRPHSLTDAVRAARVHVDGKAKARRLLLVSPGAEREARRGLQHDPASRYHYGFPERILRASAATGLLRGAAVADGAGHDDAHDPAGADMGAAGDLHPGLVPEGRRPGASAHERGRGLLRAGRAQLRRQDCRRRAHYPEVLGRQGLRAERAAVRADLPPGEQAAREICRARGLRGRVQVRPPGEQLHVPRRLHPGHAAAAHLSGTGGPAVAGGVAPALRQVLGQRDLSHNPRRLALLRRVRGQVVHLRLVPQPPQVRGGLGGREARRAARVLRGHDTAQSRSAAHHEEDGHVLLHEHHQGGELGVRGGQQPGRGGGAEPGAGGRGGQAGGARRADHAGNHEHAGDGGQPGDRRDRHDRHDRVQRRPAAGRRRGRRQRIVKGFPPVSPFIGVSPTLCYLLKEKKPLCCLQLAQVCEHCTYRNAKEYNWQNKTIILAADYASNGIYNFIIPLRAHFRSKTSLNPIILLLERRPEIPFLDAVSYFPLIYWMMGSIDNMDDLLRAGITLAENVVVVNKELSNSAEEDTLADCNTIVAVQTMFKFFPSIKSITELSQSSNMRFMQFRAHDKYALHLSKMEKVLLSTTTAENYPAEPSLGSPREKERGSHISYMFRLPFAAGSVFSASMLDTLLYQAFVKDYVITFVRLLLGVDQAPGSGFLTSMKITKDDMWIRTYGRLYQKLCSTTCEIPIGIYRTQDTSLVDTSHGDSDAESDAGVGVTYKMRHSAAASCLATCAPRDKATSAHNYYYMAGCDRLSFSYSMSMGDEARDNHAQQIERAEIANLVRSRMESLNLPIADYDDVSEKRNSLSYVIINPSCDLKLEEGDIVYLVRPSPFSAQKTFERHNSRRKSNISFCSAQLAAQMSAAVASGAGAGGPGAPASRRGSGIGVTRAPPLGNTKSNSLSLPDSPTVAGSLRGRSNSLRVVDDILLRRSNSLRQGLSTPARRKSSLEDIGLGALPYPSNHNPIKIALNGSIGLEVTPPEEGDSQAGSSASNTGILDVGLPSMPPLPPLQPLLGSGLGPGLGGSMGGLYDPPPSFPGPAAAAGPREPLQDPQHIQGTIV
ncbi:uncharacterized protein LOC131664760 isoform X6 [Phymastichus coffea]|uniref:uncharacterized protein LOC131664760 isoform X6 n=1 Tax=Phymastichus coffea TaxID=108790 RepID=UPI00273B1535|nr:uncharacterized protein LOC131664760 isoform X6 [Phymastichus coffea]